MPPPQLNLSTARLLTTLQVKIENIQAAVGSKSELSLEWYNSRVQPAAFVLFSPVASYGHPTMMMIGRNINLDRYSLSWKTFVSAIVLR